MFYSASTRNPLPFNPSLAPARNPTPIPSQIHPLFLCIQDPRGGCRAWRRWFDDAYARLPKSRPRSIPNSSSFSFHQGSERWMLCVKRQVRVRSPPQIQTPFHPKFAHFFLSLIIMCVKGKIRRRIPSPPEIQHLPNSPSFFFSFKIKVTVAVHGGEGMRTEEKVWRRIPSPTVIPIPSHPKLAHFFFSFNIQAVDAAVCEGEGSATHTLASVS